MVASYESRIFDIMFGKASREDPCPYHEITCEECRFFEKTGCYLQYKEGGGHNSMRFVEHGWSKHNFNKSKKFKGVKNEM